MGSNINNGKSPLENWATIVYKHLLKDNKNSEFEQKTLSYKDSYNNQNLSSMDRPFILMNDIINRDRDFDYPNIKRDWTIVHTIISNQGKLVVERSNFNNFYW